MFHFSAITEASFLYTVFAAVPMPPVAAKTKGEKLKGRSKLSSPHESTHHKLDISPAHGHDKIWTMEGKDRCRWGCKLAECRRKRKTLNCDAYTCFILFSGLCTNFTSLIFLSKVPQSIILYKLVTTFNNLVTTLLQLCWPPCDNHFTTL